MASLKKDMKQYFKCDNLYDLFNIAKTASADDVKKAYRKLSLQVHPDRAENHNDKQATAKFQVVGKAYSILSDEEKRRTYDETGILDDELLDGDVMDWAEYCRTMFKRVDTASIEEFEKEYVGSDEERSDLLKYYERFQGDMNLIHEHLFFAHFDQEDRYRKIIQDAIRKKEVKDYPAYSKESAKSIQKRKIKYENEAISAAKDLKDRGDGMAGLSALIQARQQQRGNDIWANLESKYGGASRKNGSSSGSKRKRTGKKPDEDEDDEDEDKMLPGDDCDATTDDEEDEDDDGEETPPKKAKPSKRKNVAKPQPKQTSKGTRSQPKRKN